MIAIVFRALAVVVAFVILVFAGSIAFDMLAGLFMDDSLFDDFKDDDE